MYTQAFHIEQEDNSLKTFEIRPIKPRTYYSLSGLTPPSYLPCIAHYQKREDLMPSLFYNSDSINESDSILSGIVLPHQVVR